MMSAKDLIIAKCALTVVQMEKKSNNTISAR